MRNGELFTVKMEICLSTSIPVFDIYVDFDADGFVKKMVKDFMIILILSVFRCPALFKDASAASYRKLLVTAYKNDERYYPLKKKISFEEYQAA